MSTSTEALGEYRDALKADRYASATIRWAGPIIVFGWIIAVLAAITFVLMFLGSLILMANNAGDNTAGLIAGVAGSAIVGAAVALVALLQASLVLVVGYYLRMRGHWIKFQVGRALAADQ